MARYGNWISPWVFRWHITRCWCNAWVADGIWYLKMTSRRSAEFEKGALDGVAAPEVATMPTGAMLPMMTRYSGSPHQRRSSCWYGNLKATWTSFIYRSARICLAINLIILYFQFCCGYCQSTLHSSVLWMLRCHSQFLHR